MANTQETVKSELREAIVAAQNRVKLKMYGHGMITKVADKTGISKYKIRNAITGDNPSIETLEQIEKALSKILKAA